MDWGIFGIGLALFIFFAQGGWKNMPNWMKWPGIIAGILFMILGGFGEMFPKQKIPLGPAILFIICCSGIVGSIFWFINLKETPVYDIEKVRRHRLRIDLTQYLSQGTIHRDWFLIFLQPTVEHGTGKPVDNTANISKKIMEIQQWNNELIAYISSRISGPKGIWFMSKIKNVQYPMEFDNNTILQSVWDTVTSSLSKIEQLLREYPELPGEAKETELADKAGAADNSTHKIINWIQEQIGHTDNVYWIKVVIRATQDLDNPIFDVRFDSQITSAIIREGDDHVPPPMTGKEHIPGGNIYHFEVLHILVKDRPITVIVESGQPIAVKDLRVRLW